jgi:hypothetical protein
MTALSRRAAFHRSLRLHSFRVLTLAGFLFVPACRDAPQAPLRSAGGADWHEFEGTWTAAGTRYMMRLGTNRQASIANLTGTLTLAGPSRPAVGFRAEAIVLNDSSTGMVGRAVWTDEHGDETYSELQGEGTATNNKVLGTILGGTGRYAGATGAYEFSWRFVLENEDGNVQGQSIGLKGRVRVGAPEAANPHGPGPRS